MNQIVSHETKTPQSTYSCEGLDLIATIITEVTGVSLKQMRGRQRLRNVVEARVMLSQMAVSYGHSYAEIGRFMCKDHSSIIHHMGVEL